MTQNYTDSVSTLSAAAKAFLAAGGTQEQMLSVIAHSGE